MNDMQRTVLGTTLLLLVVGLSGFVVQRFFLPLAWGAILCVATWPLYLRLLARSGGRAGLAATLCTAAMTCLFVIPALLALREAFEQAPAVAALVARAQNAGIAPPPVLRRLPVLGGYIEQWWQSVLGQPHGLGHLLSDASVGWLHSASDVLKRFGSQVLHRLLDFGFSFLCLFFFYKNGQVLHLQIIRIGERLVGPERWHRYYRTIPSAIRATVDGLVLVGLGEGVLIGIGYAVAGLPSAALLGAVTGVLAIIPFGAPVVYLGVTAVLAAGGNTAAAIGIAVWGTMVLFVADHFIRPTLIGNATRLPFLAVLFGILGGVETLGLVGLFIGPVLMVLFVTVWREAVSA